MLLYIFEKVHPFQAKQEKPPPDRAIFEHCHFNIINISNRLPLPLSDLLLSFLLPASGVTGEDEGEQ